MKSNNSIRKYSLLLMALFFMQLLVPSSAGSSDLVKVGVYQNAPLTFVEENGDVKGFFIDILEHIASKKGWEIEYIHSSWPESLSNLENGNIDLLGVIAYSETKGRIFDYSIESVITNWGQIYLNKKSDIKSIIDLKGKKVAVLQNDIYFNNLRKLVGQSGIKCRFIEAFEYEDVLELVEIGRCEAGLVNQIYGLQRERDYDIIKSSILLSPQKLYWAAPKGKNQELLYTLDSYLRKLKNNQQSIYYEALAKWFDIGEKSKFGKWFKWMISSFVVLLILFFAVSLILRVQVKSRTNELLIKNEELKKEIKYRKRMEEALQKSEGRLRQVIDLVPHFIFAKDRNGRFILVNQAVAEAYGVAVEELIGKTDADFNPNKDEVEHFLRDDLQVMDNSQPKDIPEEKITDSKGNIRILHTTKIPFTLSMTKDDAVLGVSIDITKDKKAEEERRNMEAQLQQAHKMESIGTLAGGIAHDFNNIIGIIIGNAELAMDDVPEWNPARHNLKEIRTASMRARDVVKQVLAFSRQSPQEMKPVRISPIIKESLKLLRSSIPTTIEIYQNISSESDTVRADPTQINQVLINLCTNAAHAMGEKGGVLEVSLKNIEMDEDSAIHYYDISYGKYVRLTVSDTGNGIEPQILERIFDPYFTTKKVGEGSGMGLSVIHGIVNSHGGGISVSSEPGKGTIFHVLFPFIEDAPEPEAEIAVGIPRGKERILFVDDEEAMVDAIQPMIERLGYKVIARTSSIEALEAFRTNPNRFDLVITDFTMPNMTGMELAKELLKLRFDIPIILCTGYSEHINEGKAKERGIRAFVMKPVVLGEIANTIRKVLDDD